MNYRDKYKDPVRNINQDLLGRLSLEDNSIRPLPGGSIKRHTVDQRLSALKPTVGLSDTPISDEVVLYEHLATVRYIDPSNSGKDIFFVAFRQTMDALLLEQSDKSLYPEHIMKSDIKKTELKTYIYSVKCLPRTIKNMRNHEDWLEHVGDPIIFDTVAYFLLSRNVITQEMYGKVV